MITALADSTIRDPHIKERMKIMHQEIIPIPVRPWTLNGISERMLVSHYENDYGGAVRALNAVRAELAALDAKAPGSRLRALKREELIAMGSVALHELYFGNLGGEGNKIPDNIRAVLEEHFGSVAAWRRVRGDRAVARGRLGLGAAHLVAAATAAPQPDRARSLAGGRRLRARARAGYVRARVSPRLRRECHGLHRCLHAQRRLDRRDGADGRRPRRSRAAERRPLRPEPAVALRRGAGRTACQGRARAGPRRTAAAPHLADGGPDGGRGVA